MKKFLVIILVLVGCNTSKQEKEAIQTVTNFLGWYSDHYDQANSFKLVNQGGSVYYSVNFEETEKYLAYIKSSGFVSDDFITYWRKYFKVADESFKKDPINDGPPPGFDFDLITLTQEPELVFEKGKNPVLISTENLKNSTILNLDLGMKLQFALSKIEGKWMIDKIQYFEEE